MGSPISDLGYNHVGVLVNRAVEIVKREKRLSLALLAAKLGYRSPEYFRRSQLRLILDMAECIEYNPLTKEVYWACEEAEAR